MEIASDENLLYYFVIDQHADIEDLIEDVFKDTGYYQKLIFLINLLITLS